MYSVADEWQTMSVVFDYKGLEFSPISKLEEIDNVKAILKTCKQACTEKPASIIGIHCGWCVLLQCKVCMSKWAICCKCSSQRDHFTERNQITRHLNSKHKDLKESSKKKRGVFSSFRATMHHSKTSREKTQSPLNVPRLLQSPKIVAETDESAADTDVPMLDQGDDDDLMVEIHLNEFEEGLQALTTMDVSDPTCLGFLEEATIKFFAYVCQFDDPKDRQRAGIDYLVKRSQFSKDMLASHAATIDVPTEQMALMMDYARLAYRTARGERSNLAHVIKGIYELGCEHGFYSASQAINQKFSNTFDVKRFPRDFILNEMMPQWDMRLVTRGSDLHGVRIPLSEEEIRSDLLHSKHAIIANLPIPKIHKDVAGHARVDVMECCRYCLAWVDCRICQLQSNCLSNAHDSDIHHSSQSKRCHQIREAAEAAQCKGLVSYVTFWSDDCDPGTQAMQGVANMWVLLMTVATTTQEGNRHQNTFPIAVGRKGISHDAIYEEVGKSLARLQQQHDAANLFYIGATNKLSPGYFEVFACLGDQPERRKENCHQGGNATFGARFMVSANHLHIYDKLKSCQVCKQNLKNTFTTIDWSDAIQVPRCNNCLNWDALVESEHSLAPLPEKYPPPESAALQERVVKKNDQWFLKPFRMSYKQLMQAVDTAHDRYTNNIWTMDQCTSYLKVEGMTDNYIERFREHAELTKALHEAEGDDLAYLQMRQQSNPMSFERVPYSASWTRPGIELCSYVEPIMHILFLGVTNDAMKLSNRVLTKRKCYQQFEDASNKLSKQLTELKISWFKAREYKGSGFAGWISENYLAIARVSLWFYQNMAEAWSSVPQRDLDDPSTPQSQWRFDQNKHWLERRGLDTSGRAKVLRERVRDFMNQDPVPEVLPVPQLEEQDFEELWSSLFNLLACAMSRPVNHVLVSKLDFAIRIFLSAFDSLDGKVPRPKKKAMQTKPMVISCYNHLCLLNLPSVMDKFGPLPDLWEGKVQGEGYLPEIKALYHGGLRDNWEFNMLQGLYRKKALGHIMSYRNPGVSASSVPNNILKHARDLYHQHTSVLEVRQRMEALKKEHKRPLSIVLVSDSASTRMFAVVGSHDSLVEIGRPYPEPAAKRKFGLDYFKYNLQLSEDDQPFSWVDDILPQLEQPRIGFALLLPLLDKVEDEGSRMFAVVGSNWATLTTRNKLEDLIGRHELSKETPS